MFQRSHGVQALWSDGYRLADRFDTLAEVLGDSGYLTVAAVSAPVVRGAASGFDQGFDVYVDSRSDLPKQPARMTVEKALGAIDRAFEEDATGASGLFLWAHFFDPHWPYGPPEPYDETPVATTGAGSNPSGTAPVAPASVKESEIPRSARPHFNAWYSGEVRSLDAELEALLAGLESRGLLEDAVVVFLADHGENLGERDLFANHQRMYRPVTEPPLLLRLPGQVEGRLSQTPVQTVDVFPTFLELAGLSRPDHLAGRSLLEVVDSAPDPDRTVFSEGAFQKEKILREGRFKLAYRLQPQVPAARSFELYDVLADPAELRDLSSVETEVLDRLRAKLGEFMGVMPVRISAESIDGAPHRVRGRDLAVAASR